MNLKFRPIIEVLKDKHDDEFVLVTAPHPVTDRMWDILHNTDAIFDIGVYDMVRESPTQFSFSPNPGYDFDQVRSIVAMGTYMANSSRDFFSFWSQGFEFHYLEIRKEVEYKFPDSIDYDLAKFVYQSWIIQEATYKLNRDYETKIAHAGINNPGITQARLEKAQAAENRLFYANPADFGLTEKVKQERLDLISRYLRLLEEDHVSMIELSQKTQAVQASAQTAINHCLRLIELDGIEPASTIASWQRAMTTIQTCAEELAKLRNKFDENKGSEILKKILLWAPPAK